MSTKNDGGPAFDVPDTHRDMLRNFATYHGITLRDWFAGMAMQAIGSNPATAENLTRNIQPQDTEKVVAHMAYKMADAMLAKRNK